MKLTQGSRWTSTEHKQFILLHEVEQDGHLWVHYREETGQPSPREYSCYKESFLARFTLNANQDK
jgi:hypothetical protein